MADAQMKTIAQKAVQLAKKSGADDAFATVSTQRKVEMAFRDGKTETVKESTARALAIRIWVNGKYGSHRSNDLRATELQKFIEDAIALTKAVQADSHRSITNPHFYENRSTLDLQLYDQAVQNLSREQRMSLGLQLNEELQNQAKLISTTSNISDTAANSVMVSSNGFIGTHAETAMWMGSSVTLQDDGDKKPASGMWAGARYQQDLPDPTWVSQMAYERTHNMLGAQKGPTQKAIMIIDPSAAAQIVYRLLGVANGSSLSQGRSFWKNQLGKKAVTEKLTITDNPLIPKGFSSKHYDAEGISTRKINIIEHGVLRNLYMDTYYGSKLGMKATTGSMSNVVVATGKRHLKEIIADCPDGIYVTNWLGGNSDGATGDYSFGVRGNMVRNGELAEPVSEMNVTGNLLDLFSKLIELGNDPWQFSSILAPTLVFDGVDFS